MSMPCNARTLQEHHNHHHHHAISQHSSGKLTYDAALVILTMIMLAEAHRLPASFISNTFSLSTSVPEARQGTLG